MLAAAATARRLPWGAARPAVAAAVGRNASKQDLGKESLLRRLPAEQWADAAAMCAAAAPPGCISSSPHFCECV